MKRKPTFWLEVVGYAVGCGASVCAVAGLLSNFATIPLILGALIGAGFGIVIAVET